MQNAVNGISLASAVTTLCAILVIGFFRTQALNRVTLRFQGLIALIDIAKHLSLIKFEYPDGDLCTFIGFSLFFLNHMYVFVNVLIALNIQLIYIHDILPKPIYEKLYILGAVVIALIFDLSPIGNGIYGKNELGFCFLKKGISKRTLYKVLLMYVTLLPGLAYCLILFIWVTFSLYYHRSRVDEKFPSKKVAIFGETVDGRDFVKKLYFRMALYPISSLIGFLPNIAANIYFDIHGNSSNWLFFVFRIGIRLTGTMNLISLLYDPHFQLAIISIYKNGFFASLPSSDLGLVELESARKPEDEEYLIKFSHESIGFEEYIKFL